MSAVYSLATGLITWLVVQSFYGKCQTAGILYVYDTDQGILTPFGSQFSERNNNGLGKVIQAVRSGVSTNARFGPAVVPPSSISVRDGLPSVDPQQQALQQQQSSALGTGSRDMDDSFVPQSNRPNWQQGNGRQSMAPQQSDSGIISGNAVLLVPLGSSNSPAFMGSSGAFDVSSAIAPTGGVSLTTGAASGSQTNMPFGQGPGGPWDLSYLNDPAGGFPGQSMQQDDSRGSGQEPSQSKAFAPSNQQVAPWAPQADLDFVGYDPLPLHENPSKFQPIPSLLNNKATANVINSGSAVEGTLGASGNSNTRTGSQGSLSTGHGQIGGSGIGIQGTSVNSAGSSTGETFGGMNPPFSSWFPKGPSSGSANAMFVNSMLADKGTVNGRSDTVSQTGANGNSFGSSSGSAMGQGRGIQLTQVANSDSEGSGFRSPFSERFRRAVVQPSWASLFGPTQDSPSPSQASPAVMLYGNSNGTSANSGLFALITRFDPVSGNVLQSGGSTSMIFGPNSGVSSASAAGVASTMDGQMGKVKGLQASP